jgi:hypothetical protein
MQIGPGTKLGHYEIDHVVGAGGVSVVYRAFDGRLERPVAIKRGPRRRRARMLVLVFAALGIGPTASAQVAGAADGLPRIEIWGATTAITAGPAGVLTSVYSPPLLFDGDFTSDGRQVLTARSKFGFGVTGGVNVFPSAHIGFQTLVDRASCAATGSNTPYVIGLQYVSRQFPGYDTQVVTVDQSVAWPDTSGTLTQLAIGFNVVIRLGHPDRLAATISGGPSYYRIQGDIQPVGFTSFHLGGHSVLFQDDYRLAVSLTPANAFGFNIGGDVSVAASRHIALLAGYRYFGGPAVNVAARPAAILNADQVLFQQTLGDISSRLGSPPMRVSVSGSRVVAGLMIR